MHQLERIGIEQLERYARHTKHIGLARKFFQVDTPLVIYKRLANQSDVETCLANARAHVDVLAEHLICPERATDNLPQPNDFAILPERE